MPGKGIIVACSPTGKREQENPTAWLATVLIEELFQSHVKKYSNVLNWTVIKKNVQLLTIIMSRIFRLN